MAQFITNYSQDAIGGLPANTTLRRNAVSGDYQIVEENGEKVLRYASTAGTIEPRALSYDGITAEGETEIIALIKDGGTDPASARIVLFGSDSPDNEYGVVFSPSSDLVATFRVYKRVAGNFTELGTADVELPYVGAYYYVKLTVRPGSPDNTILVKYWSEAVAEPRTNLAFFIDSDLTLTTGWCGHVGFDGNGDEARFKMVSVGTNGDRAPLIELGTTGTVSFNEDAVDAGAPQLQYLWAAAPTSEVKSFRNELGSHALTNKLQREFRPNLFYADNNTVYARAAFRVDPSHTPSTYSQEISVPFYSVGSDKAYPFLVLHGGGSLESERTGYMVLATDSGVYLRKLDNGTETDLAPGDPSVVVTADNHVYLKAKCFLTSGSNLRIQVWASDTDNRGFDTPIFDFEDTAPLPIGWLGIGTAAGAGSLFAGCIYYSYSSDAAPEPFSLTTQYFTDFSGDYEPRRMEEVWESFKVAVDCGDQESYSDPDTADQMLPVQRALKSDGNYLRAALAITHVDVESEDQEIFARITFDSSTPDHIPFLGLSIRGIGATTKEGYVAHIRSGANNIDIRKYDPGTGEVTLAETAYTFSAAYTVVYARLTQELVSTGTKRLSLRIWKPGEVEPATPTLTVDDTSAAPNGAAAFGDLSKEGVSHCYFGAVGVGTHGLPAPSALKSQSQFYWTAEDYVAGATPNDAWEPHGSVISYDIKTDGAGRNYLEFDDTINQQAMLKFIGGGFPNPVNANVWSAFLPSTTDRYDFSLALRCNSDVVADPVNDTTTYRVDSLEDGGATPYHRLSRLVNGNYSLIESQDSALAIPNGTVVECRGQVQNNKVSAKWWEEGTPEPADWELVAEDTNITASGAVGFISWRAYKSRIYAFGVGINGWPAPANDPNAGVATPVNLGVTSLQATSARLTWEQG